MFHIEIMSREDFPFAVQITDRMSWGLSEDDFEFMTELEPQGCFVLFDDSKRIGVATTISYGEVAWFGNLIVDEAYRSKGAGSMLVSHAINYLKSQNVRTIGLYAYMERISFYKRLGFRHDSDLVFLRGKGFSSQVHSDVSLAEKGDLARVIEFDAACFGASRQKLLEPIMLFQNNLCFVKEEDGQLAGFVVAKTYNGMAELGPLACPHGRADIATSLMDTALNRLKGLTVSMYVPKSEPTLADMLTNNGFTERFQVARMFLGCQTRQDCIYFAESLERG